MNPSLDFTLCMGMYTLDRKNHEDDAVLGSNSMKHVVLAIMVSMFFIASEEEMSSGQKNITAAVWNDFDKQRLDEQYEIAFHINTFCLRGDFNGDGKIDMAVLLRDKKSGKTGVVILHKGQDKAFILGAGNHVGNGGDDWKWMDVWSVREIGPVGMGADETEPPKLKGEALLVEKYESASGLVYWDGQGYKWYQQGD